MHLPARGDQRPIRRSEILLSPLLLVSLAALVVNDHVLKAAFHNTLTGKLSDVAGVAALALFARALAPRRPVAAGAWTAAVFAFWKSPAAQPLIDGWNALGWGTIGRVVDWTDLAALLILPLVCRYAPPPARVRMRRVLAPAAGVACVLAFAATTVIPPPEVYPLDVRYDFDVPPDTLRWRIYDLRLEADPSGVPPEALGMRAADTVELRIGRRGEYTGEQAMVRAELLPGATGGTVMRLLQMRIAGERLAPNEVPPWFEDRVIEPLRGTGPGFDTDPPPQRETGPTSAYGPRVVWPAALYQDRGRVVVSVDAQFAIYLALIEITPQGTWHPIFPVTAADERRFRKGTHTLETLCARATPVDPVPPGEPVPACAVARRMTMADARGAYGAAAPCPRDAAPGRIAPGRLVLIAANAPLRRTALEAAVRGECAASAVLPTAAALDDVVKRLGIRYWAAAELDLRG